jgi:hypothetical protein
VLMLSLQQIDNLVYVNCAGRIRSTDEFRSLHEFTRGLSCNNRTVIVDLTEIDNDIPELRRQVKNGLLVFDALDECRETGGRPREY